MEPVLGAVDLTHENVPAVRRPIEGEGIAIHLGEIEIDSVPGRGFQISGRMNPETVVVPSTRSSPVSGENITALRLASGPSWSSPMRWPVSQSRATRPKWLTGCMLGRRERRPNHRLQRARVAGRTRRCGRPAARRRIGCSVQRSNAEREPALVRGQNREAPAILADRHSHPRCQRHRPHIPGGQLPVRRRRTKWRTIEPDSSPSSSSR